MMHSGGGSAYNPFKAYSRFERINIYPDYSPILPHWLTPLQHTIASKIVV